MTTARPTDDFVRFSLPQRIEHLFLIVSFTALVLTGLPQRYGGTDWAHAMIDAVGGIDAIRKIHRFFAAVFVLEAIWHVLFVAWARIVKKVPLSMLPSVTDVRDVVIQIGYFLGLARHEPRYDRFDYRQKFEYWGVIWGGAVMIGTGLLLIFPTWAAHWFPGFVIPAAREAHGGEALLAFLVIVTWHLYGAHFNPNRFPGDTTIFTGRISRQRMLEEHPLELERHEQIHEPGDRDGESLG